MAKKNYKTEFYKYHGLDQCDFLACVICGKPAVNLHHILYKSHGGTDEPNNLAPMCYGCHHSHHSVNNPTTEEIKKANLLEYPPF